MEGGHHRELLDLLLRTSPVGIALLDRHLRYLEVNEPLMRLDGLSREACLGRRVQDVLPPSEATSTFIRLARHVLDTGESLCDQELTYALNEEGSPPSCALKLNLHPLRDEQEVVGVCVYVEDVSHRRNAEGERDALLKREQEGRARAESVAEALRESEARYRAILSALDEGIVLQTVDGIILAANASAERILGLTLDQLSGRTSMDPRWKSVREDGSPFPGEEHPAMVALRTGEPLRGVPMGVHRPDGSRVWISINAQPLFAPGQERPYAVVTSFFDDTERRNALEAIRRSEERFRALVEATTQMVWTVGADRLVREDSPSWRAYTGQRREAYLGRGWLEAVHPADREQTSTLSREAMKSQEAATLEQRVRGRDGQYRPFMVRMVPVMEASGHVREWVGTHTDISEARRAEEERARLLQEAQEAVRARDDFLSVAAHELRTPLTSLGLQLHLLRQGLLRVEAPLAEELEKRVDAIHRQLGRLAGLVNTLLDVSRLATGRLTLAPREADLAQMVRQLTDAFAEEFVRVDSAFTVSLEAPVVGWWDALRLEQVVVNLLSNAVKYGAGRPVEVRLRREGQEAVLVVKDEGIGIAPEAQARLFGKFERAVSERHYGGLGLGLYISRQIIEAMGGTISLRSEVGRGSTFTIRLPLRKPPECGGAE